MRLLLDTHILIWLMGSSRKLSFAAQRLIVNPRNEIFFSAASIFEIGTKRASGHRRAPDVAADRVLGLAERAGYLSLPITAAHAVAVETIASFHSDPFDRLLLAQAQVEDLRLVTHDEVLASYDPRAILI